MGRYKTVGYGSCEVAKFSPTKARWTSNTKVINIKISFDEALKLNLALDECVRKLNKYKRSSTAGKKSGVNLALHASKNRITVLEAKL
ncbi:MAG TPA: hypothetical protein VMY05_10745 [Acidobacteriota bacterium]|nr:hypothetical protein [Acidobacteriota bacterium]